MNALFDCFGSIFGRNSLKSKSSFDVKKKTRSSTSSSPSIKEDIQKKTIVTSKKGQGEPLPYPNIDSFIKIPEYGRKYFKAASIVPFARNEGKTLILLGLERPSRKDPPCWCDFGGKVDPGEELKPEETALREFNEETSFLFEDQKESMSERLKLEEKQVFNSFNVFPQKIWFGSGKFMVFFLEVPFVKDVREQFLEKDCSEMQDIDWFPVSSLIRDATNKENDRVESSSPHKTMRKFFFQRLRSVPFQNVLKELESLEST
eukprot:TRINITY_DN4108_c0_g2_i1.p1 TRINITY_DN4108_c0_g2~~TRINITY_DN4108_c0_g2_i1.p1  ORF type:complete len:261 (+),score=115.46 TRINITY_DN4108_c0_g2_i1:319-1101(+)